MLPVLRLLRDGANYSQSIVSRVVSRESMQIENQSNMVTFDGHINCNNTQHTDFCVHDDVNYMHSHELLGWGINIVLF